MVVKVPTLLHTFTASSTRTMKLQELLNTPVMSFEELCSISKPAGKRTTVSPAIVCKDGTTLSVQASEGHYCQPRDNQGPWHSVEVGYPSAEPVGWEEYSDGGVYGYVPLTLVQEYITQHGGEAE